MWTNTHIMQNFGQDAFGSDDDSVVKPSKRSKVQAVDDSDSESSSSSSSGSSSSSSSSSSSGSSLPRKGMDEERDERDGEDGEGEDGDGDDGDGDGDERSDSSKDGEEVDILAVLEQLRVCLLDDYSLDRLDFQTQHQQLWYQHL